MVEKMTAVWLIILTVVVCASIPAVLIYLTTTPHLILGLAEVQTILAILSSL